MTMKSSVVLSVIVLLAVALQAHAWFIWPEGTSSFKATLDDVSALGFFPFLANSTGFTFSLQLIADSYFNYDTRVCATGSQHYRYYSQYCMSIKWPNSTNEDVKGCGVNRYCKYDGNCFTMGTSSTTYFAFKTDDWQQQGSQWSITYSQPDARNPSPGSIVIDEKIKAVTQSPPFIMVAEGVSPDPTMAPLPSGTFKATGQLEDDLPDPCAF